MERDYENMTDDELLHAMAEDYEAWQHGELPALTEPCICGGTKHETDVYMETSMYPTICLICDSCGLVEPL